MNSLLGGTNHMGVEVTRSEMYITPHMDEFIEKNDCEEFEDLD